jgi:hypothetical protein
MKILHQFILLLSVSLISYGQTVKLDSIYANPGDTVLIPLQFYGYFNVGAVSLYIIYNDEALEYLEITNFIPEAAGTLANSTTIDTNVVVAISWLAPGVTGVDFPDGNFLDIRFRFISGASDLVFLEPLCEIVDWYLNVIETFYIDGRVDHLTGTSEANATDVSMYAFENKLLIQNSKTESYDLKVYDLLGRSVYFQSFENHQGRIEITMDKIKTGFYIIQLINNNHVISKKIYIKNNY